MASSSFEKDDEEIPLARFSSVYYSFSDGIKASYSLNGPSGKPKNWEAETILEERKYGHKLLAVSPTPLRETNTSAKSKGKRGKKSDTSVTSAPMKRRMTKISITSHGNKSTYQHQMALNCALAS